MLSQSNLAFNGLTVPEAWHVVAKIELESDTLMLIQVLSFTDKTQATQMRESKFVAPYSVTSGSLFSQAYDYLLTLPEFAGALKHTHRSTAPTSLP